MKTKNYGLLGMFLPIYFLFIYIIMANIRNEYSFMYKAISELGSLDAPNKWIWNIFGYILTGLLISLFSIGLYKKIAKVNDSKLPLIGFILSGLFMSLSGIFPADMDNRESTTMLFHTIGSFGSYIFFLIGAFSYPKLMKKSEYWKDSVNLTLVFTWLTIIFGSWVFIFPNIPAVGQRIVFFFYFSWIFYTAFKLFKFEEKKKRIKLKK